MWKVVYIFIIFNTNTNKFESSSVNVLDKKSLQIIDFESSFIGSKYKHQKYIKILKDSVYIPHDSCYVKGILPNSNFKYLKIK
jgi:hypothetical protein